MTVGERVRRFFEPSTPWIVLFIIGIGVLIGYGWTTNARTIRDEAVRAAETRAAADAAVARCMTSRPQLQRVSRHVLGVNEFAAVLVENSARTLEATPRSDPQYAVRKTNLLRLIQARKKIKAVSGFHVPSVAECRSLSR
jgi:hypothetical protein